MTLGHYIIEHDRSGLLATTTVHPRHPHARHHVRPYLGPRRDKTRIARYAVQAAFDGADGGGARRGGITHDPGDRTAAVGGSGGGNKGTCGAEMRSLGQYMACLLYTSPSPRDS